MKHYYILFSVLCTNFGFSQIPNGYYNNATGNGYVLKTQLYNIINQQNDQGYSAIDGFFRNYDLDNYYENNNTILDIYSENPDGQDPYNFTPFNDECGNYSVEGDCYNKEHIIPKSVFNENTPMQGDAHSLLPTDGRVNGFRGNFPMGRVDNNNLASQSGISNPTQNGSKLGDNLNSGYSSGYSGTVFEPIDEFKGDIARIHFYFATRYQNQISNWSSYAMFNGSSDQVFETVFLNILLEWHNLDPVSQKEIDRNDAIYYDHQGNRNPFVDHPEYVNAVWNAEDDSEAPAAPSNLVASNPTATSIDLNWNPATDNVGLSGYDIYKDGSYYTNVNTTSTTIIGLSPETNYCYTVVSIDSSNNSSLPSNEACETTTSGSSGNADLFFSEYMEGSSFNKALEIANFSGSTINLSNYELKLSSNGSSTWNSNGYSFPNNASIANTGVYVIMHGRAAVCTDVEDDLNNSINGFNGNDVIGLFKNGVLIDILGTLGDDSDYAKNITLVRNADVAAGSSIFNINEWTIYDDINTCEDLGSHTQTLGISQIANDAIKLYPNPLTGNTLFIDVLEKVNLEIYNLTGKKVFNYSLNPGTNPLPISSLNSGIYIVQLHTIRKSWTRKIIKQ